ncbi:hypothetical protein Tco_1495915, partial [Tanacetum coccineum]
MQIEDYLYQKKLHEPLAEAKPTGMKAEDWTLLDSLDLLRLMSVDIKFDDEVQAIWLLSSLPKRWSGIVTTVSGSARTTNLKFDNIRDLILREDIRRKTSREYSNLLLCAEDKGGGRMQVRGQKYNRGRSKSKKSAVSGSARATNLKFDNIRNLILGEDIRRKTSREYSNSLLCAEDKGRGRMQDRGQKQNKGRSKSKKR